MAVKKRCCFCRKYARPDGTCQNNKCIRFVPDVPDIKEGVTEGDKTKTEVEGGEHPAN